jgi:CheY-like chemotaxis protein
MDLGIITERLPRRAAQGIVRPSPVPLVCTGPSSAPRGDDAMGIPSSPLRLLDFAHLAPELWPVRGPLVAIVDDDDALCSSLVDLMHSIGYRAAPYSSAETFLTSINLLSVHCVVADVHMPGMSGFDLVRKLHERDIMTPVILITALADTHLDDEAIATGVRCLLRKPFEIDSLLDCVEMSLPDERPMR